MQKIFRQFVSLNLTNGEIKSNFSNVQIDFLQRKHVKVYLQNVKIMLIDIVLCRLYDWTNAF